MFRKSRKHAEPDKNDDADWETTPQFIYGGPFIQPAKVEPFMNTGTPMNLQLQGTFKKSFAYYSLKERMPIILTKVIDYCSREGSKIKSKYGASDDDLMFYIQYVTKLKNDLVTNKKYDLLEANTPETAKWNKWIEAQDPAHYFTNTWVFSECYIYRRLRDGAELTKGLTQFDPFDEQKNKTFMDSMEIMCIVAEKVVGMLPPSAKDKRKLDFQTLLKLCLWSNKCDLSLSAGSHVTLGGQKEGEGPGTMLDPFQMIVDLKDKLLVDDSAKACDVIVTKAEAMRKAVEGNTTFKCQCSCHRLATLAGMPVCKVEAPPAPPQPEGSEKVPEAPKIPCPAKIVIPQAVFFDIICDNAGYELFTDLCLASFLISQKIVQKIRFHVKKMPWFVSDVTRRDFRYVIDSCKTANYNRTVTMEAKPAPPGGDPSAPEERTITSEQLNALGVQWDQYLQDGSFVLMDEDFWTYPHVNKDMKAVDYNLYRKLQLGCTLLFKGDLNYRKLLGEKNWNPYIGFETALQGFTPAPVLAVRTVKADLICGLPKGKFEQLKKIDEQWMEKGDYGVIQFCGKAEPLKPSDKPCLDYCNYCFGTICPVHADM